jgi:spore maturation protein CgeB
MTTKDATTGFWERVRVPRFRSGEPRVLLFTSGYFLQREIAGACARLGWPTLKLPLPQGGRGSTAFLESLLTAAATFRPDFALTVNHLGLDRQGTLTSLFERMALPLASWFVDSPRLILHDFPGQTSPWCALFTWDLDTLAPLKAMGFEQAHYLPLATDTVLFAPGTPGKTAWSASVSFVGDSMTRPVLTLRARLKPFPGALSLAAKAAPGFAASPIRSALDYMRESAPGLLQAWEDLPDTPSRLDLEQFLTFEATHLHRLERVRALLPFSPLVAGDPGWRELLPEGGRRLLGPLDYYRDLPGFYPRSLVNFNATSLQMKGAVNQRLFDVPACGAFLLTDWREQLNGLFESARETACYRDPGEIPGLVRHYLDHPGERDRIAEAARKRVLAEHDYTHRLKSMLKTLRRRYA